KHRDGRWQIQRTKTMPSKQPRRQTKSGAEVDTGEANKPARDRQRAPRRRVSKARSGTAATETSSAAAPAGVAPEGASANIDVSKNTTWRAVAITKARSSRSWFSAGETGALPSSSDATAAGAS